jgi:hypothetical protein
MIIIYGRRAYGRVEVSGTTFVLTDFVHLWYLPIIPTGSHLVLSRDATGLCQNLSIPLHGVSVLTAYLRTWGAVALAGCIVGALANADEGWGTVVPLLVGAFGLAAAVVVSWTVLGKLSPSELARRQSYARFAGVPLDVAQLGTSAEGLAQSLRQTVASQARALMSGTYRTTHDPETQWAEVALDPTVIDRTYLEACLTLARIEWSKAKGETRARLADTHRKLWNKLASSPTHPLAP